MATKLHGVDLSSNNSATYRDPATNAFRFVKATEGISYSNPDRARQLKEGRDIGQVVGHYHWLRPESPAKAQAAYFVRQADIRPGDLLVCDWEETVGVGHPTVAAAAEFIAEVKRLRPQNLVGLYCNRSDWMNTTVKKGDFLWIAEYGVAAPNIPMAWDFWQYTRTPLDKNWSRFTSKAELVKWTRKLIPVVPKVRTVADAVVTPVVKVPVQAWRDVDLVQAFDVYGSLLAVIQTQKVGRREDARIRWHTIRPDGPDSDAYFEVTYTGVDVCQGAGHPQSINLNSKINLHWGGRKSAFRKGAPKRNSKGDSRQPIGSWPKTATAFRDPGTSDETYLFAYGKTKRTRKVRRGVGTYQGSTANASHFFRINGKTVDAKTKHKILLEQFDWNGKKVGTLDLTYLRTEVFQVTSLEPEGLSYTRLPGDPRPYLYAMFRMGSVAKRQVWIVRIAF